ncbi:hypothetical protein MZG86_28590, partial [Escherichia coli]|nr:hypothetical protein [Escherichia coli]
KLAFSRFRSWTTEQREGVRDVSVTSVPPLIVTFFQKNGGTPDVIRQYFPAESGRKRKRARRQPYPFFTGVRQFQSDFPDF